MSDNVQVKIKMLKTESVMTREGNMQFVAGREYSVKDWIATSLVGRGFAKLLKGSSKAEPIEADPPEAPFKPLQNDVDKAPVVAQDKPKKKGK